MAVRKRKSAAASAASEEGAAAPGEAAKRRRSLRVSSAGQKSKYFEGDSGSDDARDECTPRRDREEEEKEEEAQKAAAEADESDEQADEDAPPKVTFVPLPRLRDTGGVEYADDRLHPNTLAFLGDLKANNKRSWLKANDAEYRRALKDWESYVMTLADKLIAADPTIPELPFKDVNFRIYRDIRFSNDPTPYKAHFSAAFSRTGRKGPYACYYVHVEPSACYVGGGLWRPDADALRRLRASIDERPARWRRAFAERNKEGALKNGPKGFVPDHRDMKLLKLRNFVVGSRIADSVLTDPRGQEQVASIFGSMVGFVTHLNRIVMPDPGDDDDSDEDEEEKKVQDKHQSPSLPSPTHRVTTPPTVSTNNRCAVVMPWSSRLVSLLDAAAHLA
ncbi:hypothetical protein VTH06DRAFT_7153 [Thermothelomyces fergusii]